MSFITFISCTNESSPIDLEISRRNFENNLYIKIINNTNEDQLLYFNDKRLRYIDLPLSLCLEITHNQIPVKTNYSVSNPFWLLDENGSLSLEDSLLQKEYFDCIYEDRSIIVKLTAKNSLKFKVPLIDSIDECGRENYPILEKGKSYEAKLIVHSDSSLISKKEMEKINEIKKNKKSKFYHGIIVSNIIKLEY